MYVCIINLFQSSSHWDVNPFLSPAPSAALLAVCCACASNDGRKDQMSWAQIMGGGTTRLFLGGILV